MGSRKRGISRFANVFVNRTTSGGRLNGRSCLRYRSLRSGASSTDGERCVTSSGSLAGKVCSSWRSNFSSSSRFSRLLCVSVFRATSATFYAGPAGTTNTGIRSVEPGAAGLCKPPAQLFADPEAQQSKNGVYQYTFHWRLL